MSGISLYSLRVDILGKIREFLPDANVELEDFFVKNFEKLFEGQKEEVPMESLKPYAEEFERSILLPLQYLYERVKEKITKEVVDFLSQKLFVSMSFKEYLLKAGLLSFEDYLEINTSMEELTEEEEKLLKRIKTYELINKRIIRLKEFAKIMKKDDPEIGFVVSRHWSKRLNTYNYKLEYFPVFPAGYLSLESYKGVIITSATVDPIDLEKTLGIVGEYYELEHTMPYHKVNFIVYKIDPREEEWKDCLYRAYKYLRSIHDRVLILLTNKEHKKFFEKEEGLAFQGEESLSKLVESLREGRIKALAGLDSLWFGIDVKGDKGILMAKLPFESPEEPITFHRMRFLKSIQEDPFDYLKRKALIKFRQGIGRLLRSKEDSGTIILCDKRVFRFKEFIGVVRELGMRVVYKNL